MASHTKSWLRPRNIVLAILALAVIAFIAYKVFAPPPPPNYLTAPARTGSIEETVLATGAVQANKLVAVGSQASGQIRSLKVALGDKVRKGDLIAEIDSLTQQNSLRNAEAALASARAQLTARQATLQQSELAYRRARDLLAQDAGSRETLETAEAAWRSAQADIKVSEAQIEQARITADTARLNIGYTRIVAPMDGTVVAILNEEGTTVNANQSTPSIIKLARMDTVTVKAQISEADVTRVKPGQKVYFTILGEPDHRYETTLRAVEPAPDSISSTTTTTTTSTTSTSTAIYYNGLLDVPNPDDRLRISMTTQVNIVLAEAPRALVIPSVALGERGRDGLYEVRVLDAQGRVSAHRVKIGLNNNTSAQVLEGLGEGDEVVLGEAAANAQPVDNSRRMRPPRF
ncbi:MAG: efflux RND transporter periplasmic adaptor subunit [Candidatus Dactylopiibacterium sp.]|nr:efflux RND transporter periplasmic adaptor subunit [Candidatus Dactylopiibacterium sp.]